jgi:hypothetical protein
MDVHIEGAMDGIETATWLREHFPVSVVFLLDRIFRDFMQATPRPPESTAAQGWGWPSAAASAT